MPITLDAHQHFWRLDQGAPFNYSWLDAASLAPIRRDFMPADLEQRIPSTPVKKTIFVQTQHHLEENRWALDLAERHEFIAGVVGWVDLASEECERQLLEFKSRPKFVGIRHIVQDEPDDDFVLRGDVLRGLKTLEKHGVPFDLLFYVKHLRHASTLAQRLPDLRMVIDHLAKPHIKQGRTDDWLPHLQAAAKFPNVYCKLSGMITEADWRRWTAADLKPYVQAALECFGAERCMFGSDWPVCELAGSYEQAHQALVDALGPISGDEQARVFGETAKEFYRLPLEPGSAIRP